MRLIEFIKEGKVLPFKPRKTQKQKYDDSYDKQTGHRFDVGIEPCKYCDEYDCDYDCDESQADGFE